MYRETLSSQSTLNLKRLTIAFENFEFEKGKNYSCEHGDNVHISVPSLKLPKTDISKGGASCSSLSTANNNTLDPPSPFAESYPLVLDVDPSSGRLRWRSARLRLSHPRDR